MIGANPFQRPPIVIGSGNIPKPDANALYEDMILFDCFENAAAVTRTAACGATTILRGKVAEGFLKDNADFGSALYQSYALNVVYRNEIENMGQGLTMKEREEMLMGIP